MPCADILIGRRHRVCEVMERVLAEDWLNDPHACPLESGSPGSDDRDSGELFHVRFVPTAIRMWRAQIARKA